VAGRRTLDADAITASKGEAVTVKQTIVGRWVLTPVDGEFRRLFDNIGSRLTRTRWASTAAPQSLFLGNVVDDIQNAEAPVSGELIVDEVERPANIGPGFDQDRRSRANGLKACPASAH
jgi:hypothetical protein